MFQRFRDKKLIRLYFFLIVGTTFTAIIPGCKTSETNGFPLVFRYFIDQNPSPYFIPLNLIINILFMALLWFGFELYRKRLKDEERLKRVDLGIYVSFLYTFFISALAEIIAFTGDKGLGRFLVYIYEILFFWLYVVEDSAFVHMTYDYVFAYLYRNGVDFVMRVLLIIEVILIFFTVYFVTGYIYKKRILKDKQAINRQN